LTCVADPVIIPSCHDPHDMSSGGCIYHAINRTVARLPLFKKDRD
jgi:hypothetical protein